MKYSRARRRRATLRAACSHAVSHQAHGGRCVSQRAPSFVGKLGKLKTLRGLLAFDSKAMNLGECVNLTSLSHSYRHAPNHGNLVRDHRRLHHFVQLQARIQKGTQFSLHQPTDPSRMQLLLLSFQIMLYVFYSRSQPKSLLSHEWTSKQTLLQ